MLQRLSSEAREALSQRLYSLHSRIFDGVSYETFRKYVVFSTAWRTWLYVRQTPAGEWVGYTALHAFRKTLQGRPVLVFRMEMGSLETYRGYDLTILHVLAKMIGASLRHWHRPTYIFSSFVHPSSYALAARYCPVVWPNRDQPTPAAYEQLLQALADDFQLAPVSPPILGVRQVSWITRETTPPVWDPQRNPHVAYFLDANPGYGQGEGLLTVIRARLPDLLTIFVRFAYVRGRRLLRRR